MVKKYLINKGSLFTLHIVATLIILFIIYYIYAHYYKIGCKCNKKENFTPRIRETYRPYIRHARIVSEGFYGNSKNNVNRFFRKIGLY